MKRALIGKIALACSLTVFAWIMIGMPVVEGATVSIRASDIMASLIQSRTGGVAPLSVFFDASATTDSSVTSTPFHDLQYVWDFGDPAGSPVSGTTWAYGARPGVNSRNAANGPEAAHVYENVGTFTATLTVYDGSNVVSKTSTPIVVTDPNTVFSGTNTICVSGSGAWTGCPSGAAHYTSSNYVTALNASVGTGKRILFNRGEVFTSTTQYNLQANGPGIIGAYGTGAKPSFQASLSNGNKQIQMNAPTSTRIGDWRIMDIDFNGLNSGSGVGIGNEGNGLDNVLVLRVDMHNLSRGFEGSPYGMINLPYGMAIVDNNLIGCTTCGGADWRIYMVGYHLAIMGNYLDNLDTGGSHVIRSEFMQNSVISNNTIAGAGDGGIAHEIKLHSWGWSITNAAINPSGTGAYTQKVVIDSNKIVQGINGWGVAIAPQNSSYDERIKDIIVQNNWFTCGTSNNISVELYVSTVDTTTVRNNIFDISGPSYPYAVDVTRRGPEPAPNDTRVYNNTIYMSNAGQFVGIKIDTMDTNSIVKNNLGSAPSATSRVLVQDYATGTTQSNNLLNTTPASIFSSATPSAPADFALVTGTNLAVDAGTTVPVFNDFILNTRPFNSVWDIGAYERH